LKQNKWTNTEPRSIMYLICRTKARNLQSEHMEERYLILHKTAQMIVNIQKWIWRHNMRYFDGFV